MDGDHHLRTGVHPRYPNEPGYQRCSPSAPALIRPANQEASLLITFDLFILVITNAALEDCCH